MPRAVVQQQTQLGIETIAGTPVDANILLPATSFTTGMRPEISAFRPIGQKYVTMAALTREYTEASLGGIPSYTDLLFLLAGILCEPESAAVGGSTGAYQHEFRLQRSAPDDIVTYTVEQGDPSAYVSGNIAHAWSYGLITELGLEWRRTAEPTVSGQMLGRQLESLDETMTAASVFLSEVPIIPGDVCLYLDDTDGSTKLEEVSRCAWRIGNRFGPRWVLDCEESSWIRHVELPPELTVELLMDADAGMDIVGPLRLGDTLYFTLTATSAQLANSAGADAPFMFDLKMGVKVTGVTDFQDDDGTYALGWTFAATPALSDGAGGYEPLQAELVNDVNAFVGS